MLRFSRIVVLIAFAVFTAASTSAQELLDRIVARVENDVILFSEIRALGRYQSLVDGKSESDPQLLERLIDQWIVRSEADNAHFPRPADTDVSRGVDRLRASFTSPQEYDARQRQAALTDADVRTIVSTQLYLSNYLDSRFRPAVQVDPKQVEIFYQEEIVPRAKARNQEPPSLEAARDSIQEALIQRGINEQADRWLKESRARLHVDEFLNDEAK
jgi:hypothetical protein